MPAAGAKPASHAKSKTGAFSIRRVRKATAACCLCRRCRAQRSMKLKARSTCGKKVGGSRALLKPPAGVSPPGTLHVHGLGTVYRVVFDYYLRRPLPLSVRKEPHTDPALAPFGQGRSGTRRRPVLDDEIRRVAARDAVDICGPGVLARVGHRQHPGLRFQTHLVRPESEALWLNNERSNRSRRRGRRWSRSRRRCRR